MLHTTGWLEGGLVMSYEKFMLDADQAGMIARFCGGIDMSENGQALDALREVGPGQHFLGCAHTQSNFESAFHRSTIADNNSVEQWQAEGGLNAAEHDNKLCREALAQYAAPELDPQIDAALQGFIKRRKGEFADQNY